MGRGADIASPGKKTFSRYKSRIWFSVEKKYDATKRECLIILKVLKKVRYWLYEIRFVLEIDANVLITKLNWLDTDLPRSLVTRWIAWI